MGIIMQKIGRYEILAELGRGAMGVVYSAMDPLIGRQVAIKTIRLDTVEATENREELTRRLFREAQSAGVLSHPGIVTIHDVGEQANEAYIVMEYVDGRNLEDVLASGVPQRSGTLLTILRQSAAALDYAHGKGIIHRDIKPSNIMLCNDGVVKIADFGVAKLIASTSMTQAGLVLGTPSYMSPEQAQGHAVDGRSDQFSLAVIAYRMLTGDLPFQGATLTAILTKLLLEEPQYDNSGLHPYLQTVFRKALAKSPQLRFANCTDFVRDLEGAYSLCKAEMTGGKITIAAQQSKPADSGTEVPIAEVVATASQAPPAAVPVEIAKTGKAYVSQAPAVSSPQAAKDTVQEGIPAVSGPPSAPQESAEPPKRKSMVLAWVASLAVIVVVAVAFLAITKIMKQETPGGDIPSRAADTTVAATVQGPAAGTGPGEPKIDMRSQPKPEKQAETSGTDAQEAHTVKSGTNAASMSSRPGATLKRPIEESGIITWSGKLDKNAILVIAPPIASIGKITGELPGKPVSVKVDPPEVIFRQMPDKENGYRQLMLYSGSNQFSSITIHWKTIPQ